MTKWNGVPEHSDWDGWHWVGGIPRLWDADQQAWKNEGGSYCPAQAFPALYGEYEGPCLTPMEVEMHIKKAKKEATA